LNKSYIFLITASLAIIISFSYFVLLPLLTPDEEIEGVRPRDGISLVHSDHIDISSISYYVITTREPNFIEVRFNTKPHDTDIKPGIVGIYFPYDLELNKNHMVEFNDYSNWHERKFEYGTAFVKNYTCSSVEDDCSLWSDPQVQFILNENEKFTSKNSFNNNIRMLIDSSVSDARDFFLEFEDSRNLTFNFDPSTRAQLTIIIPEKSDKISPIPDPEPSIFHNRGLDYSNTQLNWKLSKNDHTFLVDFENPEKRKIVKAQNAQITLLGIVIPVLQIPVMLVFNKLKKVPKDPLLIREHSIKLNDEVFKKLQYTTIIEDSIKTLSLRIPRDQLAFDNHDAWFIQQVRKGVRYDPTDFIKIDELTHLSAALEHLERKNYKKIWSVWTKIQDNIVLFNDQIPIFLNEIKQHVVDSLKENYAGFDEFHGSGEPSYFSDRITFLLFDKFAELLSGKPKPKFYFDLLNFSPEWRIQSDYGSLMQSMDKESLNIEKFQNILYVILDNQELSKKL